VAEVLAKCGLQPSKGAARRLIKGGGVRLNNRRVESDDEVVGATDVLQSSAGELLLVAAGKKNKHIVRVARGAVAA
jgi:tyrosyl-tRNA synthetase